ncbi:hypothetical protein ElyMa_005791400 [Elysia marginata]|uniref:Uncharacterized protein n=1 Tax=Elysia marginata TaxID=1093978 RepID=A0AAV4FUV4_9GAST|nr:hypothetical protein ElyMa_005791400 [Elysia marginata]
MSVLRTITTTTTTTTMDEIIEKLSATFVTKTLSGDSSCHKRRDYPDVSGLELFYLSTANNKDRWIGDECNMNTAYVDKSARVGPTAEQINKRRLEEEEKLRAERCVRVQRQVLEKKINDFICGDDVLSPLGRHLHRCLRERQQQQHTRDEQPVTEEEEDNNDKKNDRVRYISTSFLLDGVYALVEANHKRAVISDIKTKHFAEAPPGSSARLNLIDSELSVRHTIFHDKRLSTTYEDNLQRLLLSPAFGFNHTMRLAPRGALVAHVAMFSPEDDPELQLDGPNAEVTTLRALLMNIIDGSLYHGMTIGGLLSSPPLTCRIDGNFDSDRLKHFCDNLLLASHRATLLTFLRFKPWRSGMYPSERFIINSTSGLLITIKSRDVILDDVSGHWLYAVKGTNKTREIRYASSFDALLYQLLNNY